MNTGTVLTSKARIVKKSKLKVASENNRQIFEALQVLF